VPEGYTVGDASYAELQAAGFHGGTEAEPVERKPGTAPASELTTIGEQLVDPTMAKAILAESTFRVMRDPERAIVATWDEGRWWTPAESDAYSAG
jgi:hypothetical protein